ncbi:CDP-glucose 4,6-dehydratase [Selenomonas bovis]|uniref:CDP-glucose 4,6-dehydratase n=1 Tax=Selenomonas bovis TaxID=416586 RepID=UPI003D05A671
MDQRTDWMEFYQGRRVLVTGYTGFKGMWLVLLLRRLGAEVAGYSLDTPTREGARVCERIGLEGRLSYAVRADVRDFERLRQAVAAFAPEVVFHLAAQPIVRKGYLDPRGTYETNVMGTVNILESIRETQSVRSFLNVTTDKVYENQEWCWGYRENEPLDGYDPYSNSKSCSELVTHSYARSFFCDGQCAVSTARAGNVIGGGDFAPHRILPDCIRSAMAGKTIEVHNPHSVRPYQHVLEPLSAYLMIAAGQYEDPLLAGWYNVGPEEEDCLTTGELTETFCSMWGGDQSWKTQHADGPHEANYLKLDCSKLKNVFHWRPTWHIEEAVRQTVQWAKAYAAQKDILKEMEREIETFLVDKGDLA